MSDYVDFIWKTVLFNFDFIRDPEGNELPKSVMNKIILFQKKQKKDTIDIWWLSDDGGFNFYIHFWMYCSLSISVFDT